MFPLSIRTFIQTLVIVALFSLSLAFDRKISSALNPGCESDTCSSDSTTLVHVQAIGSHDTVHQIWDFTRGIPTVIFAITGTAANLSIGWHGSQPDRFNWTEKPKYSFAVILDKLYEYNDLKDIGYITPDTPQHSYSLEAVEWSRTHILFSDEEVELELKGRWGRHSEPRRDGYIDVKLDVLPYTDYALDLPHLIHSANSTLLDLALVGLGTRPGYNSSRFAWSTTVITTDAGSPSLDLNTRRSLDDEHTPGVFEIVEIRTAESVSRGDGGFLQYRPVAYTSRGRGVASSTPARHAAPNTTSIPPRSTASIYYDGKTARAQALLVSFGESADGFYAKSNYTAWSLTVGYGVPPVEGFSLFVIIIISIGLGVPVLLALSGIVYVISRRRRNGARRFDNED